MEEQRECIKRTKIITRSSKLVCYSFLNYIKLFSFNQAIKLNPENDTYWNNKGFTLDNLGKYEEAIDW